LAHQPLMLGASVGLGAAAFSAALVLVLVVHRRWAAGMAMGWGVVPLRR